MKYEFGPFRLDTAERLMARNSQPEPRTAKACAMCSPCDAASPRGLEIDLNDLMSHLIIAEAYTCRRACMPRAQCPTSTRFWQMWVRPPRVYPTDNYCK